jgi:hypothetical protein
MATDNVQIPKCSDNKGPEIASDLISGVQHQRVKVQYGADGTAVDVSSSNPLPVDATVSASFDIEGVVDAGNSQTSTTLLNTESFTGSWAEVKNFSLITVLMWNDAADKAGTLYLEFSMDNATVHRSIEIKVDDASIHPPHTITPVAQYYRTRYVADGGGSKDDHFQFQLQTIFHPTKNKHLTSRLTQAITDETDVENTRSVVTGKDRFGNYHNVCTTPEGGLHTVNPQSTSAFGEHISVEPKPAIQLMFPYGKETANVIEFTNGSGSVTNVNSQLVLSSGATTLSDAAIASKDFLVYEPGFGATAKFTFGCSTGAGTVGTFQQIGMGTQEDGFFFSYENDDMTIMRRQGGLRDQHSFTITTEAGSSGNVTVELDGTSHVLAVSIAPTSATNFTASEIASEFNLVSSTGYTAYVQGNIVSFVAERTGVKSGSFTFSGGTTSSTATVSQEVVGVTENIDKIERTDWNIDKADGTGMLPLIDWSQGNVFQMKYQWLGYGAITFFIENPSSGNLIPVHRIQYANSANQPSINNPSLQFLVNVANALTTANVSCFVGSVYGGIDGGRKGLYGNRHAETFAATVGNTNLENIVSFRAPHNFAGKSNRSEASIVRLGITSSTAADIKVIKNPTLEGSANWTSYGSGILLESDQSSGDVTGGDIVLAERAEKQDRFIVEASAGGNFLQILKLYPGDVVTICGIADSGNSTINVAVNWVEPL